MENDSIKLSFHPFQIEVFLPINNYFLFQLVLIAQGKIYLPWVQNEALIRFHDMNISIKRSIDIRKGTHRKQNTTTKQRKERKRERGRVWC